MVTLKTTATKYKNVLRVFARAVCDFSVCEIVCVFIFFFFFHFALIGTALCATYSCYSGHFWVCIHIHRFMCVIVVIQSVAVAYANLYAKTTFKAKATARELIIHSPRRTRSSFLFFSFFLVELHRCHIYFNIYERK